jgi:hypothetical protein
MKSLESFIDIQAYLSALSIFFVLFSVVLGIVYIYLKKKNMITIGASATAYNESIVKEVDYASPKVSMQLLGKCQSS